MKEVTFGQYYLVNSPVHKMNASVKILLTIAYVVAVFLVAPFHFFGFALCFAFLLFAILVSRVPLLKVIKSIKAILFFIIFSAVLQIFLNGEGQVVVSFWIIKITDNALWNALFIVVRITLVVLGASLLTYTTSPVEIADGIEVLMYPLKWVKFPVHEFALIMSIALRFIPTLLDETDRIIQAQKARGAEFESKNLFKKAKALIPVLIPLLISSFRRADELADAMDSRCYVGSKNRTKFKKPTFGIGDAIAILLIGGLITGVVLTNGFYFFPALFGVAG